jgi:iron complex transport system substrate-binding protein
MRQFPPRRIVCLTEETVETLYLLGEEDRIVGVSGYLFSLLVFAL